MQLIVILSTLALANMLFLKESSDRHMALNGYTAESLQHEVKIESVNEAGSLLD